jgi:hypothetical protein
MDRAHRRREAGILSRAMLARAWLRLGILEALLVTGGYLLVLLAAGWLPGDPTGAGAPLHHAYLGATTMTWAGIVACQMAAHEPARSESAPTVTCCVASRSAPVFAAAIIYGTPLQSIFKTAALPARDLSCSPASR